MLNFFEKLPRRLLRYVAFWLPAERHRRLERWLRGWEQCRKLDRADVVVVSYGKSGRTWLRVMLSRYYQLAYGLPERSLLGFDNLHRKNRAIPRIFLTHDNYIADFTGHRDRKPEFYGKRVILLARSPQDVAVSQYFQWKFRMKPGKKALNDYPPHGADVPMADFLLGEGAELPKIVDFMNLWAHEIERVREGLILRYEDLRADPVGAFRRVVRFVEGPEDEAAIRGAVEYASVENMRRLEERRFFWWRRSMKPRDRGNPDSYKVRRAKVGGYRDYFSDDEVTRIDGFVRSKLSPAFGYAEPAEPSGR